MDKPRRGRPPKSGDETLSDRVFLRVTASEKAAYDQAAESSGIELSEWIRAALNKTAKQALKKASQVP